MCRGFQPNERELLKIKAFYTRLSLSSKFNNNQTSLPDYLTLHYLPRINGALLQINGSSIRPDSPGFVTLHRVFNIEGRGFGYGSRERVVVCEGARFEVYAGDVKVLKGIFRRDDDGREINGWKMECKSAVSANGVVLEGMRSAEVSVAAEGAVMTERVEMAAAAGRRRRRGRWCELEEIPEEREEGGLRWDVCGCSECGGGEEEMEMESEDSEMEMEMEMEGVRWAVDVGIWVVCIGVGYLVCNSRRFVRRKLFI